MVICIIVVCSIMYIRYAIVEFVGSKRVTTIPTSWFTTEEKEVCYFQTKMAPSKLSKLLKDKADPLGTWRKYDVRVLGKAGDILITLLFFFSENIRSR